MESEEGSHRPEEEFTVLVSKADEGMSGKEEAKGRTGLGGGAPLPWYQVCLREFPGGCWKITQPGSGMGEGPSLSGSETNSQRKCHGAE